MKRIISSVLALTLMLLSNSCALFQPQDIKVVAMVPVDKVFANVLKDFDDAKKVVESPSELKSNHTLTITEADVIFDNTVTDETASSLSLLIFRSGYTYVKRRENTVTYSLLYIPPSVKAKLQNMISQAPMYRSHMAKQHNDTDGIKELIIGAANQFLLVNVAPGSGHIEKYLQLNIAFTVDQNGNIEFSGPVGKLTPEVKFSRDVQNIQTITLKMVLDKKS